MESNEEGRKSQGPDGRFNKGHSGVGKSVVLHLDFQGVVDGVAHSLLGGSSGGALHHGPSHLTSLSGGGGGRAVLRVVVANTNSIGSVSDSEVEGADLRVHVFGIELSHGLVNGLSFVVIC